MEMFKLQFGLDINKMFSSYVCRELENWISNVNVFSGKVVSCCHLCHLNE